MKIPLYTHSHEFVTEVELPPFVRLPEMLRWGSRFFVLERRLCNTHEDCSHVDEIYVEGFLYTVSM